MIPSRRLLAASAVAIFALVSIAFWPARTRAGLNYEVSERRIPLWRKAWEFTDRHRQMRQLATTVAGDAKDELERARAVLAWTRANVRRSPPGAAVVDDHVWSIIERGHGSNDQRADVYATLLTYSGVPAYWTLIGPTEQKLPITLVRIDTTWRVIDVDQGIVFTNARGEAATAAELAANRELVAASAFGHTADTASYADFFTGFRPPRVPAVLRSEMQMPIPRLRYEAGRVAQRARALLGVTSRR